MTVGLSIIDAFTDRTFAGNPAAVCLLGRELDDALLQRIAAEMNLSETAFVRRVSGTTADASKTSGGGGWLLRWFTPTVEVPLCGHATLASAHRLWELGEVERDQPIRFVTRESGVLTCTRDDAGTVTMDFPADPPAPADPPDQLLAGLGIARAEVVAAGRGRLFWVIELGDESAVAALRPDYAAMRRHNAPGVGVTARSRRDDADIVCRFFAPTFGIDEDPVTGALHCILGPYWSAQLGRDRLVSHQISSRGGVVTVTTMDDRVALAGRAVTVVEGHLRLQ